MQLRRVSLNLGLPDPLPQLDWKDIQAQERILFEPHPPEQVFPGMGERLTTTVSNLSILHDNRSNPMVQELVDKYAGFKRKLLHTVV